MKKNDKFIVIFYIFLAFSYVSILIYLDAQFEDDNIDTNLFPSSKEHIFETTNILNYSQITTFDLLTDIEKYPTILPKYVVSVKIINQTKNEIFVQESIKYSLWKFDVLVKHTLIPYDQHKIEILDGHIRGTTINQTFSSIDNSTTEIITTVNPNLTINLTPLNALPTSLKQNAINEIVKNFELFLDRSNNSYQKEVDAIYREVLLRPADPNGLNHFVSMLENNQMTIDEIRNEISESEESKSLQLTLKYEKEVDAVYREILLRPADPDGLNHYISMLKNGQLTIDEVRDLLLNSEEAKTK